MRALAPSGQGSQGKLPGGDWVMSWGDNDLVTVDVDRLAAREGVVLRSNLQTIHCQAGSLVVTAGK